MKESKILGSKGDIARKLTVRLWGEELFPRKKFIVVVQLHSII